MFSVQLLGKPRPAHYNGFSKYSHLLEDAQYIRDFAGSDLTRLSDSKSREPRPVLDLHLQEGILGLTAKRQSPSVALR